jgi:hypothetical protein
MEFSAEIFGKVLTELSPKSERRFDAECASSYSDLSAWRFHPDALRSSRNCKAAVVVISLLGLNPIQEEDLRKKILTIADKKRYQGKWSEVRDLVLTSPFVPYNVLAEFVKNLSPQDFFGNEIKRLKRIIRSLRVSNPYEPSKRPVKYPERKRGYDDKGTLRDPSTDRRVVLPELPKEPLPEISIASPLWYSDLPWNKEKKIQQGTLVGSNTSPEGGDVSERKTVRTSIEMIEEKIRRTRTSETVFPIFDWEGTSDQRTKIVASFYHWAINENKNKDNKALFLFYIIWAQGKSYTTYFGLGPSSTQAKYRRTVLKELVRKPLDQIRLKDLKVCFPGSLSNQGVG